jgi:flagellin
VRLNHNLFSLSIYNYYKNQLAESAKASNNVGTGSKLNSAKDNPGKIGENETLKIQVLTNDAASKNVQNTNSMLQTFDGGLQNISDDLTRMKELTVSAGSGTLTDSDKKDIQAEIDSIKSGIDSLANNTEFNDVKLSNSTLTGNATSSIKTTIGNMDGESMDIPFYNVSAENLGVGNLDISNVDAANAAVDKAIDMVSKIRGQYGSIQNQLEGTADYLSSKDINIQTVQSSIGDADIATEMSQYSKSQVLIQASIALMAQSNNFPKDA